MPAPPEGVAEQEVESRQTTAPCSNCHAVVDPIGNLFDHYGDRGELLANAEREGGLAMGVDIDNDYDGVVDFSQALGNSRALKHCMVRQWYRFALGRDARSSEMPSFEKTREALNTSDSLSEMIKVFTGTESFSALHIESNIAACQR